MHSLKLLTRRSAHTGPAVSVRIALGISGLLLDAALPLVAAQPKEAARLLQQGIILLREQLHRPTGGSTRLQPEDSVIELNDMGSAAAVAGNDATARLEMAEMTLLRLLLTCLLSSGQASVALEFASSFLASKELFNAPTDAVVGEKAVTGSGLCPPPPSSSSPSKDIWDVWLLSISARIEIEGQSLFPCASELNQAIGVGCGLEVASVALNSLLNKASRTLPFKCPSFYFIP